MEVSDNPLPEGTSMLDEDVPLTLIPHDAHIVTFDGVVYPIGRVSVRCHTRLGGTARRVGDEVEMDPIPQDWLDAGAVPPGTEVVILPGSTNVVEIRLIPR